MKEILLSFFIVVQASAGIAQEVPDNTCPPELCSETETQTSRPPCCAPTPEKSKDEWRPFVNIHQGASGKPI